MGHLALLGGSVEAAVSNIDIIVNSSDSLGYLSVIIGTNGVLTVGGVTIALEQQVVTVPKGDVEIVYTLNTAMSKPRTLYVDGVEVGIASAAGTVLKTTISAPESGEITIEFKG